MAEPRSREVARDVAHPASDMGRDFPRQLRGLAGRLDMNFVTLSFRPRRARSSSANSP
jgi:hypothetical protein